MIQIYLVRHQVTHPSNHSIVFKYKIHKVLAPVQLIVSLPSNMMPNGMNRKTWPPPKKLKNKKNSRKGFNYKHYLNGSDEGSPWERAITTLL